MAGVDVDVVYTSEPSDWHYLSEGGASIVFAYAGPPHPTLSNTVLRLRKSPTPSASNPNPKAGKDKGADADEADADDPSVAFQRTVSAQLLAPAFLPRLQLVSITTQWLAKLATIAEQYRPTRRRAIDQIDLDRKTAVLATNLVGHDGLAVEIKPKWGFLPRPTHLSPHTRARKTHHCRFCMHVKYLASETRTANKGDTAAPIASGSVKAEGYCPLDLYSGEELRVQRALGALWDAWDASGGRVNNLKVFVAGRRIDPAVDEDIHLLAKALSITSPDCNIDADVKAGFKLKLKKTFVAALLTTLLESPVPRQLAHLQRTLDPLDIEGLFALHILARGRTEEDKALEELYPEPDLGKWEDFVAVYKKANPVPQPHLGLGELNSTSTSKKTIDKDSETKTEIEDEGEWEPTFDLENLYYFTLAYLLSATFKDCSLMLRPPLPSSNEQESMGVGSIKVIDLDPKSIRRLRKWYDLDRSIVDAFKESGIDEGAQEMCVDSLAPVYH